jgi:hypothetical protein
LRRATIENHLPKAVPTAPIVDAIQWATSGPREMTASWLFLAAVNAKGP